MRTRRVFSPLVLVLLIAATACVDRQKIRAHTPLGANVEAIRTQFNADAGRVRVVMLVAPT